MQVRTLILVVLCLPLLGAVGCKRLTQGYLGSTEGDRDGTGMTGQLGSIRSILGQLDFETSQPLPLASMQQASPSEAMTPDSRGGEATVRMQFSVSFDTPAQSLELLAQQESDYVRVGTLTTFDINHEPVNARLVSEEIGRPVFLVPVSSCKPGCLRLVTGGGSVKDRSQVIILEFAGQGEAWTLKWFSYFGKEIKDYGLPVRIIRQDALDGPT